MNLLRERFLRISWNQLVDRIDRTLSSLLSTQQQEATTTTSGLCKWTTPIADHSWMDRICWLKHNVFAVSVLEIQVVVLCCEGDTRAPFARQVAQLLAEADNYLLVLSERKTRRCATCHTSIRTPTPCCRCRLVYYCCNLCQIEDMEVHSVELCLRVQWFSGCPETLYVYAPLLSQRARSQIRDRDYLHGLMMRGFCEEEYPPVLHHPLLFSLDNHPTRACKSQSSSSSNHDHQNTQANVA